MKNIKSVVAILAAVILLVSNCTTEHINERQGAMESMTYDAELLMGFDEAVILITEQLKAEQFGIVSRIDLHTTFKKKLDVDIQPHAILGACNPTLAYKAVSAMPEAAVMLPCNVTVQAVDDKKTIVRIVNPAAVMLAAGLEKHSLLREVGEEANARLKRVVEAIAAH